MKRLLLAIGNPGRGDDGLGYALALRVAEQVASGAIADLEVEHRYQLNVEDAELIVGFDAVLVADAAVDAVADAELRPVQPGGAVPFTTHGLGLPELLALGQSLYGQPPPVALLALRGEAFAIGEGLSEPAQRALEAGLLRVAAWLGQRATAAEGGRAAPATSSSASCSTLGGCCGRTP